ncbi:MAG: hypothetical protein EBT86_03900 [Actinobacteria bacterium]|nr:hypothetical protein [Actinomycetota bacterium]
MKSGKTRRNSKKGVPFWPPKYYSGLTRKQKLARRKEIKKFGQKDWQDPTAYRGFKTNVGIKTRKSSYTANWQRLFPNAHSLKSKSEATGVPLEYIQKSYDRGLAAWRTGHRPGATQQQWGYARVHSFLLCGKTHYGPDADLVRKSKTNSKSARNWFKRCKDE